MLPERQSIVKCPECSHVYWVEDAEQLQEDSLLAAATAARIEDVYERMREKYGSKKALIMAEASNAVNIKYYLPDPSSIDAVWCLDADFADLVSLAERENSVLDRERHVRIKIWWMWNNRGVEIRYRYIQKKVKGSPAGTKSISMRGERIQGPLRNGPYPSKAKQPRATKNLTRLVELFDIEDIDQRLLKVEALRELGHFEEAMSLLEDVSGDHYAATVALQRELCEARDQRVRALPADRPTTIYLAP